MRAAAIGSSSATGKKTPTVAGRLEISTVMMMSAPSKPGTAVAAHITLDCSIFCGTRTRKNGMQITNMSRLTQHPAKR